MKTVSRIGVFETNSSSTHSLMLMSKDELDADRKSDKPRTRRYRVLSSKLDKMYLACGCCKEIFADEKTHLEYHCTDEDDRSNYYALKKHEGVAVEHLTEADHSETIDADFSYELTYSDSDFSYEVAIDYILRVYCRLTGKDYDKVFKEVDRINHSGRACHMKFFSEGALYDADCDYYLICRLFFGTVSEIDENIADYFDDDNVVCYRECYAGICRDDDD